MAQASSEFFRGTDFNNFLFAPVGEEGNGMILSVQSALARLNVDPWQEAIDLSRLPREAATRRLATLIDTLPETELPQKDSRSIAVRLIGLLPRPDLAGDSFHRKLSGPTMAIRSPILMLVIFVVLALSFQWIASGQQSDPGVAQNRPAASPATTIPDNTGGEQGRK